MPSPRGPRDRDPGKPWRVATTAVVTLEPAVRGGAGRPSAYDPARPPRGRNTLPRGFRNGLPALPPYAYRGTGEDVLQGTYGDPLLDEPYDF